MEFMSQEKLEKFYRDLKHGDIVVIVQDLSGGKMIDNMISTSVREFGPSTSYHVRETLKRDTILEVSKRTYW